MPETDSPALRSMAALDFVLRVLAVALALAAGISIAIGGIT